MEWSDGKGRCRWANPKNPAYIAYHDSEWGRPLHDDRALFELLVLETFQAGLSWRTVLAKREAFRAAFEGFSPDAVAAFVFAYVGSADHRQHTSSMTHARAHTTMVWRNCWRMRFFSSCAILFRRIRLRYSRSSMMAPSRCCVCAVALCCGKSPA